MNLERIRELIKRIEATGEDFDTSPATDSTISEVEARLGCCFPPSYREFLTEFGAVWCSGQSVSGIHDDEPSDESDGTVLGDTKRYRDEFALPNQLVVVQADDEAPYCLDLSVSSDEPPVVCFQLNTGTYERITDGFESFLIEWFLEGLVELVENEDW